MRRGGAVKRVLGICFLALGICQVGDTGLAQTPIPTPKIYGDIPFVTRITPDAAPPDAVVQISIQATPAELEAILKYRLTIGGATTQFYRVSPNDNSTLAAVVPKNVTGNARPGASVPVEIVFYNAIGDRGVSYKDFSVLVVPPGLKGKAVEIAGVKAIRDNQYNITFNDYIPVELWPQTKIYIDGSPVRKIYSMEDRAFTIELPAEVSSSSRFDVFARVGDNETSVFKYDRYSLAATPTPTLVPNNGVPTVTPVQGQSVWPYLIVGVFAVLFGFFLAWIYRRRKSAPAIPPPLEPYPDTPPEFHALEDPPPALVDACVTGDCVLYAGAGLAAQAGLPTWNGLVRSLLVWARENNFINDDETSAYLADLDLGQADPVADSVVSRLTIEQQYTDLNRFLQEVFLKRVSPSALHSQIKEMNFSAVLTTNFDNMLEEVYDVKSDAVYTPKDPEQLLAALTRRAFFILKLYGRLDKKETVIVAPAQYEDAITGNSLFSEFMQTLFFSRTLLFIGASLEGIKSYLEGISLPKEVARKHYAVVAVTGPWRAQAELLERRYGIKVIPYTPSENYGELKEFLSKLREAVAARQDEATRSSQRVSRLKRISLQNIGPFENLNLELDLGPENNWHVFLGDNGVGKSTVLKAIALALCGKEAQPFARRLLRDAKTSTNGSSSETVGKITLETDNRTSYVTTLRRHKTGEVELTSTTARPLEAEGWLALGFPPLRTTSWEAPKGPDADIKRKSRPVVSDLLPLVSGDVDPRLDKLKQWIVNLDYLDAKNKDSKNQYSALIQKMFDILGEIAEGMKLVYKGVGEGNRILVETQDGTLIPLEGLSQGTISLIGWIGIFMQRLYEVFDEDKDPTQRYALILMDEIDAHMHPLWQRTLVTHLKDIFPNAQFIATTHSPLVIAGMPANQVVRFSRDEAGVATVLPIEPDMTQGYTDQVLTSMLFGLSTTLPRPTEKKMGRFYELDQTKGASGKPGEYENLRKDIIAEVPPWTASYDEKHAVMRERADVLKKAGERLRQLSPKEGDMMVARADHLLANLGEDDND